MLLTLCSYVLEDDWFWAVLVLLVVLFPALVLFIAAVNGLLSLLDLNDYIEWLYLRSKGALSGDI